LIRRLLILIAISSLAKAVNLSCGEAAVNKSGSCALSFAAVRLTPKEGAIRLLFPKDRFPGEQVSARVFFEPDGQTVQERRDNEIRLKKYKIRWSAEGKPMSLEDSLLVTKVPDVTLLAESYLELLDSDGHAVAKFVLDDYRGVEKTVRLIRRWPSKPNESVTFPVLQTAGAVMRISGPFDGDLRTAKVLIHGQLATAIVETEREIVVDVPTGIRGPHDLQVEQGRQKTRSTVQFFHIDMVQGGGAPSTGVSVLVRVEGLQNLGGPIRLVMGDYSRLNTVKVSVTNLRGQDTNHRILAGKLYMVPIAPRAVQGDGIFQQELRVTLSGYFLDFRSKDGFKIGRQLDSAQFHKLFRATDPRDGDPFPQIMDADLIADETKKPAQPIVKESIVSWERLNQTTVTKPAKTLVAGEFEELSSLIRERVGIYESSDWFFSQQLSFLVNAYLYDLRDRAKRSAPGPNVAAALRFLADDKAVPQVIGEPDVRAYPVRMFYLAWYRATLDLGVLHLTSTPQPMDVFADGAFKRTTDGMLKLSAGDHFIEIKQKGQVVCSVKVYSRPGLDGYFDCPK
jgi:hypothetical protein